jgi:hypothetical protein
MPRIVYPLFFNGRISGGQKMSLRHIETLRDLGFDAVGYIGEGNRAPDWLEYDVPLEFATPLSRDDIVVVPDDAAGALSTCLTGGLRTVVFAQSIYNFAATTFDILDEFPAERFPRIIGIAPRQAAVIQRAFPQAGIEIVPCFADERRFAPGEKRLAIAFTPRKRPLEVAAIQQFFRRFSPHHGAVEWIELKGASEMEVAATFSQAGLHLSLSRLEAVGMTSLEAMASGCLCVGFTGIGGREYATDENGFWVDEDDCLAAADALARAADLLVAGGPPLERMLAAGRATAEQWSYVRFRDALGRAWMKMAPEARNPAGQTR